ncbi:malectin domain-containing carbohydrate-binding protein [Mucilaginibacter terrae]|uniref:Beta-galactosidase n=1 Tax=Mucilaginibacter terrae TaxID=1955052 RepID=A0ABU3GXZ8_9SPHI|nr:malectin domain-containing carbohydrate-binding protein [Mucilaginibacter terrae]MDT3404530.1 beta-galactosidase [Mucilaginibacter terrae]
MTHPLTQFSAKTNALQVPSPKGKLLPVRFVQMIVRVLKYVVAAKNTTLSFPSREGIAQPQRYLLAVVRGVSFVALIQVSIIASAQTNPRQDILLNNGWQTVAHDTKADAYTGFEQSAYKTTNWKSVTVPHNWDGYEGYRRLKHGNRHGYSWYRKTFTAKQLKAGQRYFLWFEGVSSYATVYLNGKKVGYHAGGRTTFTLDVTNTIKLNQPNLLAVKADHPANIQNLPWVCGGCSDEVGFSEGSQPMGIFRPVHLIATNPVRIQPFGVYVWNDTTVTEKSATLHLETELKNYGIKAASVQIINRLTDASGKQVALAQSTVNLSSAKEQTLKQDFKDIKNVHLWSDKDPYLYTLYTQIIKNGKVIDEVQTPYGIRWIKWGMGVNGDNRFYINGKPVFINGVGEYEHLMGKSHAFSNEEIKARVMQLNASGFNGFRDAHQPHNLEYQKYWDKQGTIWWPQFSAHIWYDMPEFKENYKALIVDWIKERRNSPSAMLWGLENESKLPEAFARECTELIRSLDHTASSQRKVTTCNGGKGTDWDVPQNWTGTYGGNPLTYGEDLKRQVLVGEYGAWRSLELHTEGPFIATGPLSEDRMAQMMETKVRLADSVKNEVAGHYHWIFYSHENPGRIQGGEGLRELDRVGPINYKGLFTPWGQPLDAFYMFRSNYAPKDKEPMVYIVSHTWPNRWLKPGKKDSISVYSNCDEVELFNDVKTVSLGKRKRGKTGTHFQWDGANIQYNMLYAVGYVNGKVVAEDYIVLNHLPKARNLKKLTTDNSQQTTSITKPASGKKYLYRVNCGGAEYKDSNGNIWLADKHQSNPKTWGSTSWTDDFEGMPDFFASQQRTFDAIKGTADGALFQTFRYGMDKLKYEFPLPDGKYQVELYFNEPWYGIGGGMDCTGWRLFDVALNGKTVISNLDIWKEAGVNQALKKTVTAQVTGGRLIISFPNAAAGEAIISAIAISTPNQQVNVPQVSNEGIIASLKAPANWSAKSWLDVGDKLYAGNANVIVHELPPTLFGAEWLQTSATSGSANFNMNEDGTVYVGMNAVAGNRPEWLKGYEVSGLKIQTDAANGATLNLYRKAYKKGETVTLGANVGTQMYMVAVLPNVTLAPATDLRKTITYRADDALAQGNGAVKDTLSGRKVVRFTQQAGGVATFAITPGVGDVYALRIKYYNFTDKPLTGKMKLLAEDGTVMKEEDITFGIVKKGKSGTHATSTGTSINAGNYRVVITGVDAKDLNLSGVEMQ